MGFWKIALLIIATLACGSAALAGSGGRGTSRSFKNGATHFFIVRTPLPIWQAPASTGTVAGEGRESRAQKIFERGGAGTRVGWGRIFPVHLFALRRGAGSGARFPALTALRMAISANISGPLPSTASSSISAAICHSGCFCFRSRQLTGGVKLAQQLRQLGDVHRVPLRFIAIIMI
jgi:hypothetical protein